MKPKAKNNIRATQKNISAAAFQNSEKQINVLKEISKNIGTSHDTYYKAKIIKEKNPAALIKIDSGHSTINKKYQKIK